VRIFHWGMALALILSGLLWFLLAVLIVNVV